MTGSQRTAAEQKALDILIEDVGMRLECLTLAEQHRPPAETAEQTVQRAAAYYAFVSGAPGQVPASLEISGQGLIAGLSTPDSHCRAAATEALQKLVRNELQQVTSIKLCEPVMAGGHPFVFEGATLLVAAIGFGEVSCD